MDFRADSLDFSQPLRGSGPRRADKTVIFPRNVVSAVAGLTGYLAEFSPHDDHHVGKLQVTLDTAIDANGVTVTGHLGVRDWSGEWDDNYDGSIDFVVIAQLESATAPPARGDLAITGVEFNQATQFFRANRFLNSATVQPDNSVFMIDGKNTGVRVYVDYDATSGLPPIGALSGEMVVHSGSNTATLAPINGPIVPKRDALINQASANDTLNFMIPASMSTGSVTVSVRVFDSSNPTQSSGSVTRTLNFAQIEPLNVFLVGVNTQAPAAMAPTQAAIASAFSMLVNTYPRGVVQFTGFNTITLTPNIAGSMATSGCGDAWSQLLSQLRDLRGGSGDLYFGGLPAGISAAGVIGCSPVGERIAASFIDLVATIPHEVGHALGREHDPCRGCSPGAQDPDNNYPQYGSFSSDSIGVFGFDPTTNRVFNPAVSLDFMTAFLSSNEWVSPYTYRGLLGPVQGGPAPSGAMTQLKGERHTLFLGLDVARDRKVTRRISFHHDAVMQGGAACGERFSYELLDDKGSVLDCGPLGCHCASRDCSCWPKHIDQAVGYPKGGARLVVYENENEIYREDIPAPPTVSKLGQSHQADGIALSWEASDDAQAFIVHYRDEKSGHWRGLAPRSTTKSALLPWNLIRRSGKLHVRVLASSGIATGYADIDVKAPKAADTDAGGDVAIKLLGASEHPSTLPSAVAQVLATDATGASLDDDKLWWYGGSGASLARGSRVDLRQLPEGRSVVRVVAKRHGGFTSGKSWVIQRTGDTFTVHAAMCDPPRQPRTPTHEHPHAPPTPCED